MKKLNSEQVRFLIACILLAAAAMLCLIGAGCVERANRGLAMVFIIGFVLIFKMLGWSVRDYKASFRKERCCR